MASSNQNVFLAASAMTAAVTVVGLTALQSDVVSRRILSPESLQAKRMQEYAYRWEQANEKALLRVHYLVSGGVSAVEAENMQEQHQTGQQKKEQQQAPITSKIWDDSGVKALIDEWVAKDKQNQREDRKVSGKANGESVRAPASGKLSPFPRILGVTREEETRDLLLEVYHAHSGIYQLPLLRFGMALAEILENTVTTTALCFVADASSGLASRMIPDLLDASKTGVAIIREPIWMTSFASIAAQRVMSREKMERIIFGLCRMEALRVREQVGEARTVMFTLPGQAVTPVLLPLLQAAFPEDRHVFAYDGCAASIERAMAQRKRYQRATVPKTLQEAVSFTSRDPASSDPTRFTTPLRSGLTRSVLGLSKALAAMRLYHADTIEAWMASVDAFFKLKEDETTTLYLPYTLKLDLLLGDPNGSLEHSSNRFYTLSSLLQFITGCRSRPLPEGVLDAAREWTRDFAHQQAKEKQTEARLSNEEKKALENCVFAHKLILIQDKTLKDTVLPKQHWTLKQAVKGGCACCAPEEEDEEEESNVSKKLKMMAVGISRDDSRSSGGENGDAGPSTSGFVDGKSTFAFDPSKFSTPAPAPSRANYVDGKSTFAFDPTKFS